MCAIKSLLRAFCVIAIEFIKKRVYLFCPYIKYIMFAQKLF